MQIIAKFNSTCPKCGKYISAGSKVEWPKGAKATHVSCATDAGAISSKPAAAPKKTAVPTVSEAPYVRQEKWEPCKRIHLPDTTGDVRVVGAIKRSFASVRDSATGEPLVEGDAVVVVGQTAVYENAEQNEDMGDMSGAGWHVTLYLRRATAEEAAPALAKAAEARAKKDAAALRGTQIKELEKICREGWISCDDDAKRPSGPAITLDVDSRGSARRIAVLSEDGLGVAVWDAGYYDDYRWSLHVSRDPRAVVLFLTLEGKILP